MLARVGADQEIAGPRSQVRRGVLEQVARLGSEHVVGVAANVGPLDGVTDHTGDAFLVAWRRQVVAVQVLAAGEQRDGVMAAGAVARRLGAVVGGHGALHALEERRHCRVAVRARLPLGEDLGVAARHTAALRTCQVARLEGLRRRCGSQARRERVVAERQLVVGGEGAHGFLDRGRHRPHDGGGDEHRHQSRAAPGEAPLRGTDQRALPAVLLPEVPHQDDPEMPDHEGGGSESPNQMHEIPGVGDACAPAGLPGENQATDAGQHQRYQRQVAEQLVLVEWPRPIGPPVTSLVNGVRHQEHEANDRVDQHRDLGRDAEAAEVDEETGQGLEQEQAGDGRGEGGAPLPQLNRREQVVGRRAHTGCLPRHSGSTNGRSRRSGI